MSTFADFFLLLRFLTLSFQLELCILTKKVKKIYVVHWNLLFRLTKLCNRIGSPNSSHLVHIVQEIALLHFNLTTHLFRRCKSQELRIRHIWVGFNITKQIHFQKFHDFTDLWFVFTDCNLFMLSLPGNGEIWNKSNCSNCSDFQRIVFVCKNQFQNRWK